jgi:hypothetical protein
MLAVMDLTELGALGIVVAVTLRHNRSVATALPEAGQ